MAMLSRNHLKSSSSSSSFYLPRYVPLLVFFSAFAFLFLFNLDSFISRTKSIARQGLPEETRVFVKSKSKEDIPFKPVEENPIKSEETPIKSEETTTVSATNPKPISAGEEEQRSAVTPEVIGPFHQEFDITWGDGRAQIHENGTLLTLSLDKYSGSGFRSKNEYLFAKIQMRIKLIAGNSAGTVTTYYLSSEGSAHDEIDFEFLGNSSGDPYTLHTNVYCQGKGNREQQFQLWFDPTSDFHTYSILWNPQRILFSVDDTPIREFKNMESMGLPFPKDQPMKVISSLWNADDWATQGGRVKTDWSKAPFVASYRDYKAEACVWFEGKSSCSSNSSGSGSDPWFTEKLNTKSLGRLKWAQKHHMVYNYCADKMRFPEGLPPECKVS